MPSLAEIQRHIKQLVLQPEPLWDPAVTAEYHWLDSALEIHRSTVLAGLVRALTLTFPSVVRLLGEHSFAEVAADHAREQPPRSPVLHQYGENFPGFLRDHATTRTLAYLSDLARFDLAVDRTARGPLQTYGAAIAIGPETQLRLDGSFVCLQLDHPADLIRDALEAGGPQALTPLDLRSSPRSLALWRTGGGAGVRVLSAPAALFITAVLEGRNAAEAWEIAATLTGPEAAVELIRTEILSSSFIQLTRHP
jgi:hypothetical protein